MNGSLSALAGEPQRYPNPNVEFAVTSRELNIIRNYVAYRSVGASTVRGLRTKGVVSASRLALKDIQLKRYSKVSHHRFDRLLDSDTQSVLTKLPKGARHWGVARKVLNIYLRSALYNIYLNEWYELSRIESLLEVPLDSISAKQIRGLSEPRSLPRWTGVKYVTPDFNTVYQDRASELAAEVGTKRVHLDALFWGGR